MWEVVGVDVAGREGDRVGVEGGVAVRLGEGFGPSHEMTTKPPGLVSGWAVLAGIPLPGSQRGEFSYAAKLPIGPSKLRMVPLMRPGAQEVPPNPACHPAAVADPTHPPPLPPA